MTLTQILSKLKSLVYSKTETDTLLGNKAASSHTHTKSQIIDFPSYGNTAGTICQGNDARLSDARTPTSHTHTKSQITDFPTIPTVNNATLKIQKNGTDVKTFTANASTDVTCNITVPTKVSQLTNDSKFVNSLNNYTSFSWDTPVSGKLNIKVDQTWLGGILTTANTTIPSKTSQLTNDSGFLTSHQSLSGYVPKSGGNVMTGSLGPSTSGGASLGDSSHKWKTINGYDVTGIGHIGSSLMDQSGDVKTYTRTNPNVGHYAHYCVAPDNGWVACREHNGNGTFQVCSLGSDLNSDPLIISPPLDQYQFGSIPVRKGEYYAIISNNESASYTMRFRYNNG